MLSADNASFLSSVKGKVFLGFFIASLALGASWFITKLAFEDVRNKLANFSTPNDKLRLVNKVFKNILELDYLQNARSISGESKKEQISLKSGELQATLDSLMALSLDDPIQINRIHSMKQILKERDRLFGNYIQVRSKLVSNKALSDEVAVISGIITSNKQNTDSALVKTATKTTTTTTFTEVPDTIKKVIVGEDRKGFFNRVFKKNKKTTLEIPSKIIQKQVVNLEVDTVKVVHNDSTIERVDQAVQEIEKSQKIRTTSFVDREQELANAGSSMVRELLQLMQAIETKVVKQSNDENIKSKEAFTDKIEYIQWIMLGFLIVTVVLAYLIFTDIARSNKYRNQLEEAKEEAEYHGMAKQRFLSNMSHEIRTPLQSIIGYTEALKKAEKPKKQDLNSLHSASEHLLYLVNEVLDYSRIVSDQFTFENRVFSISPLLKEVVQMLLPTAKEKGLTLTLANKLSDDLYLMGDPFRIRQVLYNLLTNAIKFTEKGEVILHSSGTAKDGQITLDFQVSDTGIGLSNEQLQRVFNQFEQADASIARRYGGTGLGLSIVKALVEGMNGTIHAKSLIGKGTTFFVKVVLEEADTPMTAQEETERESYNIKGKVWLVDDDAFILKWCSSVLAMHNVDHSVFSSAEEVLAAPWDNNVRFVLTDMRMQGLNGAELCQKLRPIAPPGVKFYVLTAQALPEERAKLMDMGFDGILMKPFHSNQILELLEKHSVEELPQKNNLDFSLLTEMTFGDDTMLREVLDQFVNDSREDLASLRASIANSEMSLVHELLHRMAGRISQIGAKGVAAKLRHFEIAIRDGKADIALTDLLRIADEAQVIVEQVEEKALSYSM